MRGFLRSVPLLVAVASFTSAVAQPESGVAPDHRPAPYQRVTEDAEGAGLSLEMAVRELKSSKDGQPAVYLVAAVHIGEKGFYESLQEFLDKQDVVLFEGVKPPGAGDAAPPNLGLRHPEEHPDLVVGEAVLLGAPEQLVGDLVERGPGLEVELAFPEQAHLLEEPGVDARQAGDVGDAPAAEDRLPDAEGPGRPGPEEPAAE